MSIKSATRARCGSSVASPPFRDSEPIETGSRCCASPGSLRSAFCRFNSVSLVCFDQVPPSPLPLFPLFFADAREEIRKRDRSAARPPDLSVLFLLFLPTSPPPIFFLSGSYRIAAKNANESRYKRLRTHTNTNRRTDTRKEKNVSLSVL